MGNREKNGVDRPLPDETGSQAQSGQDVQIVIADQFDQSAITIRSSQDFAAYEAGEQKGSTIATAARLGTVLQAVPSLLTAGEVHNKQLMEVVVNGNLVRAADGNGFRAFAMGPKGVQNQARLFKPEKLQNIVNAGAVWQIASVVVAQKHLADINNKLDAIGKGVTQLSRFLDQQRKSQIEGAYRYLGQAREALMAGEIPASVRTELERCERDLLAINLHLQQELVQGFSTVVPDTDTVGTEELTLSISRKIREQDALLQDLALGIRTRICAWHVLSLFPGEPMLKEARRLNIQQAIKEFGDLAEAFEAALDREIQSISAIFNRKTTLERRREALKLQAAGTVQKIKKAHAAVDRVINDTAKLLLKHDEPVRMLLQYKNGHLEGVSQVDW